MGFYLREPTPGMATAEDPHDRPSAGPARRIRRGSLASRKPHRGPISNRILSSKYADRESYLYYYGYRYYAPAVGRWVGKDPLGDLAGAPLYCFAANSPVMDGDILGLLPLHTHIDGWNTVGVRIKSTPKDFFLMDVEATAVISGPPECSVTVDMQIKRDRTDPIREWSDAGYYGRGPAAPATADMNYPNMLLAFDYDAPANHGIYVTTQVPARGGRAPERIGPSQLQQHRA
jgi:RHS repeat-associated protein